MHGWIKGYNSSVTGGNIISQAGSYKMPGLLLSLDWTTKFCSCK